MADYFLKLYLSNDDARLKRQLNKLDVLFSAAGLSSFMTAEIGPYVRERAQKRFASEGDDAVGSWAPLMLSTQMIRAAGDWPVGPDHPINRRTGELEDWVTKSAWQVSEVEDMSVLMYPGDEPGGELASKVRTAQSGKSSPKTVARPVLAMNEADEMFIVTAMSTAINEAVRL